MVLHHPVMLCPLPELSKCNTWLLLCYKSPEVNDLPRQAFAFAHRSTAQPGSAANLGQVWLILICLPRICGQRADGPRAARSRKASLRSLAVVWLSARVTGGPGQCLFHPAAQMLVVQVPPGPRWSRGPGERAQS